MQIRRCFDGLKKRILAAGLAAAVLAGNVPMLALAGAPKQIGSAFTVQVFKEEWDVWQGDWVCKEAAKAALELEVTVYDYSKASPSNATSSNATPSGAVSPGAGGRAPLALPFGLASKSSASRVASASGAEDEDGMLADGTVFDDLREAFVSALHALGAPAGARSPAAVSVGDITEKGKIVYREEMNGKTDRQGYVSFDQFSAYLKRGYLIELRAKAKYKGYYHARADWTIRDGVSSDDFRLCMAKAPDIRKNRDYSLTVRNDLTYNGELQYPIRFELKDPHLEASFINRKTGEEFKEMPGVLFGGLELKIVIRRKDAEGIAEKTESVRGEVGQACLTEFYFEKKLIELDYQAGGMTVENSLRIRTSSGKAVPKIRYTLLKNGLARSKEAEPSEGVIDQASGVATIYQDGHYTVSAAPESQYYRSETAEYHIAVTRSYEGSLYEGAKSYHFTYQEGAEIPWPKYAVEKLSKSDHTVSQERDGRLLSSWEPKVAEVNVNSERIQMRGAGKLSVKTKLKWLMDKNGNCYRNANDSFTILIDRAEQSGFAFQPDPDYSTGSNAKPMRYAIPYGAKDAWGEHRYRLCAAGQLIESDPVYRVTEGEEIASLRAAAPDQIEFADKKTGTVRLTAEVPEDHRYLATCADAEILVEMPRYEPVNGKIAGMTELIGEKNKNGWYREDVQIRAASGYRLSTDYSFLPGSDWRKEFIIPEGNPAQIRQLYILDERTGVIGDAGNLPELLIDSTRPEKLKISYRKPLKEIILQTLSFGFYQAKLEVTLSAEDERSGVWRFGYELLPQEGTAPPAKAGGAVYLISEGDPGFRTDASNPKKGSAVFDIDPQYRGRICFYAEDKAGNRSEDPGPEQILVIDDQKPEAALELDLSDADVNSEGIYFRNEDGKRAELLIREPNFFPEDEGLKAVYEKKENGEESYRPLEFDRGSFRAQAGGAEHRAWIPFPEEGHYRFRCDYRDPSGNEAIFSTPKELCVTIDKTDPEIALSYDQEKKNKNYFKTPVNALVSVTEENFSAAEDRSSISYSFTRPGEKKAERVIVGNKEFTAGNPHRRGFLLSEDGRYELKVGIKDLSGRSASASDAFVIDKTPPEVFVELSNEGLSNEKYFREDRTGSVTVRDYNLDIRSLEALVEATDQKGKPVQTMDYSSYLNNPANWTRLSENEYRIPIRFTADANYRFGLKVRDYAGNENQGIDFGGTRAATAFTIDHQPPGGAIRIGEWDRSKDGTRWDRLLNFFTFGRWSQNKEALRIHAEDSLSGVYRARYFRSKKSLKAEDLRKHDAYKDISRELRGGDWSSEISPDDAFITYVHIQDYAGNDSYLSSDGVILDNTPPQVETLMANGKDNNGLYNKDVAFSVAVTDPLVNDAAAGLRSVEYHVYNMGDVTQNDTLFSFGKEDPALEELDRSYDDPDALTVDSEKNNSNEVVVKITGTDNAGNTVEREEKVAIDITPPVIEISYDNNDVRHERYFNRERTATITIRERNFDPKDVILTLTASNGRLPALSEWTEEEGRGNGDDTRWSATIPFTEDGDYTLDVAYTDLAGNAAGDVVYAAGGMATESFTIDQTAPVLTVSYDNNDVRNQNYYKENRVATVRLEEHNFSEELVRPVITAEGAGSPAMGAWGGSGDTHIASIPYAGDGKYSLAVTAEDLAGNQAAAYETEEFLIDTTVPELKISGVEDQSANRGEVIPVVEYSDHNLDAASVRIQLEGSNRGVLEAHGHTLSGAESGSFIFDDFPYEKKSDDIYTLSAELMDMAGNTAEQKLLFSVNRFGSTYMLSEETKKIHGSYARDAIDIRVKEINVDPLTESSVTLFRNEDAFRLAEGVDYTSEEGRGSGSWHERDYTVPRRNFESDALYGLSLHSEDRAGNISDNTQDIKDAEIRFAIDRTAPELFLSNMESGGTYTAEALEAAILADDNLKLEELVVYVDGRRAAGWGADAVRETAKQGGEFTVSIPGTSMAPHELTAVATDAAGNESSVQVSDFIVTTNPVVSFLRKRVLKRSSLGGVMFGLAALAFGIGRGERKKKRRRKQEPAQ